MRGSLETTLTVMSETSTVHTFSVYKIVEKKESKEEKNTNCWGPNL